MQEDWIEQVVLKLVGEGALAYALHPDGMLSVVNSIGQKFRFAPADYQQLLPNNTKNKTDLKSRGKHVQS